MTAEGLASWVKRCGGWVSESTGLLPELVSIVGGYALFQLGFLVQHVESAENVGDWPTEYRAEALWKICFDTETTWSHYHLQHPIMPRPLVMRFISRNLDGHTNAAYVLRDLVSLIVTGCNHLWEPLVPEMRLHAPCAVFIPFIHTHERMTYDHLSEFIITLARYVEFVWITLEDAAPLLKRLSDEGQDPAQALLSIATYLPDDSHVILDIPKNAHPYLLTHQSATNSATAKFTIRVV